MIKFTLFAVIYFALAAQQSACQASSLPSRTNKDGWGPWKYTDFKVSGIEFRSKCLSNSDKDSKWAYQFRSRFDSGGSEDFAEREEIGLPNATKNAWNTPQQFSLKGGSKSPVFETRLHGTCAAVHEMKIEILCIASYQHPEHGSCFDDANGREFEAKRIPENPRYR